MASDLLLPQVVIDQTTKEQTTLQSVNKSKELISGLRGIRYKKATLSNNIEAHYVYPY